MELDGGGMNYGSDGTNDSVKGRSAPVEEQRGINIADVVYHGND